MDDRRRQHEPTDERLAANIRVLRERMGMSQAELAKRMSEHGWPWHQQTVYRVESGRQPVRLAEAAALAKVLETSIDRLTWPTAEASATEWVYAAGYSVRASSEAVAAAVHRLLIDIAGAERVLAETEGNPSPRVQEARKDTRGRIEEYGVQEAIDEGVRRYEERGEAV